MLLLLLSLPLLWLLLWLRSQIKALLRAWSKRQVLTTI